MNISTSTLLPFAFSHGDVESVSVNTHIDSNLLSLTYVVDGDIGKLRIPTNSLPHRADRLWEHTCFEAFIRNETDSAYCEFNFSPCGEWAAYSFRGYRDGMTNLSEARSPEIVFRRAADKFALDAVVRLDRLPAIQPGSTLQIGLAAVIETSDGSLYYWALKHPAAKPDFHHPDSFTLEIPFPGLRELKRIK